MMLFSCMQPVDFFFRDFYEEGQIFGEYFKRFWRKPIFLVPIYFLETLDIPEVLAVHSCRFTDSDEIL